MPNWCTNKLEITGDEKELKKFTKKVKKKNFMNSFLPTPKELTEIQSPNKEKTTKKLNLVMKYGKEDWYTWNITNWGTKWDFEVDEDIEECKSTYHFDSAWAPPIQGIETISKSYPNLVFFLTYEEEGMGFRGIAKIQNGKTEDACFNY